MARACALRFASFLTLIGLAPLAARSDDARANVWPPPAGADMRDPSNWPSDPDYAAQWDYRSWLPDPAPGAGYLAADRALGASGTSVDRAWTVTVGRSDVVIAVIGPGIAWESEDLITKVRLNPAELTGTRRPQDAKGAACEGAGAVAGYDCDGDGVFTVHDYAADPRITPVVAGDPCYADPARAMRDGPDRIAGDVNHDCVLDAGDLVQLFADGVDDDQNGYRDDIAGWDFFKNDNDPYDDTRDGDGTRAALGSVAQGNNARGSIGVCPGCRFLPLRAGDAATVDANDFAKAVIYAADNGARVIQVAVATIDSTPFAQAAIDYAYARGVVVVTSTGDEDARHHVFPGAARHTFAVHALTFDGDQPTTSTTFLDTPSCANFGPSLALRVSTNGCANEAVAHAAGIAGLVVSAAGSTDVSAEEIMQLLAMTADDIDVPESRLAGSSWVESKPGWDQRFGRGRANAFAAVSLARARALPPEIDIASPAPYAPIYGDRVAGQVPIVGRVAAARALSYDYQVDWAPGVEPDDDAWKPLVALVRNVPSSTVTGSIDMPLATLDPRQIDAAHPADPDSPHHENDHTITLRVRAVAHYTGRDVPGEARRAIAIVNERSGLDVDLLPGFPLALGASAEASPKLADLDGDHARDIVIGTSDGWIHAFTLKSGFPTELPGFPSPTLPIDGLNESLASEPTVPSYVSAPAYRRGALGGVDRAIAREAIVGTPAVGDMKGDGKLAIAVTTWPGTMYLVDAHGAPMPGWPKRLPLVASCGLDPTRPPGLGACMDAAHVVARGAFASPVLIDLDGDRSLEIVQAAFDGNVYAFHADGSALEGFPVLLGSARILSTPAAVDANGDRVPDLIVGSTASSGGSSPVAIVDGRGTRAPAFPGWPIAIPSASLRSLVARGVTASPAAADFDGDGRPDLVLQGNGAPPRIVALDPSRRMPALDATFGARSAAALPDAMVPLFSHPSIGDLDQDGTPDVVSAGGSPAIARIFTRDRARGPFQHLIAMWSGASGLLLPGAPAPVEGYALLAGQAIADIDGDDYPEVIAGTSSTFVHAIDACGREPPGWPKPTFGWTLGTPAVGDVDGAPDRGLEVVAATREGYLFAWRTRGHEGGVVAWESFHHDNANTGDYARKLDQGTPKRAAVPIDCSLPVSTAPATFAPGGCSASPRASREAPGAVLVALALTLAMRRSRRRQGDPELLS